MKMKPAEFITLSACSMILTALGIDIMLPVFAELRKHFGLNPESTATAQIIGFFFIGQIAQIIFGALSDRFGRLAILRLGFPLYIIGGIVSCFCTQPRNHVCCKIHSRHWRFGCFYDHDSRRSGPLCGRRNGPHYVFDPDNFSFYTCAGPLSWPRDSFDFIMANGISYTTDFCDHRICLVAPA